MHGCAFRMTGGGLNAQKCAGADVTDRRKTDVGSAEAHVAAGGQTRSIMTQTMYRDSETQTDPFSPPINNVSRPLASQHELLQLACLSYGSVS